jgi:hypothetical protein
MRSFVQGFTDELVKLAVRIRVMHGTNQPFPVLVRQMRKNVARDPNPSAVHVALQTRRLLPGVEAFANQAVHVRGTGRPVVGFTKVDTKRGWVPRTLQSRGKKLGLGLDDVRAAIHELDYGSPDPKRRGELWRTVNTSLSGMVNQNPETTLRVRKYRSVRQGR